MTKKTNIFIILIVLAGTVNAQLKTLRGVVLANGDVEGVHILNKSSVKYTVTNTDGSFEILAKPKDTLTISALKYQTKEIVLGQEFFESRALRIYLIEKVNELEEVVVGEILTGNIGSDIGNVELKDEVNFYDLGIPGYTGKPKTIPERKLADADAGNWGYVGLGFGVNFHKLLNKVSGRTKKLKAIVELDEKDKCMKRMRDFYSESIFDKEEFTEPQKADYFYFCMDDLKFKNICNRNDPSEVIPFFNEKLKAYKLNLNSKDD
ncbi:carboxypeptidase-like regulatory domain-containing protein [uncultured Winogradskyella sp.]|uniref:carboxypeptidase-like regulatory domain-containing protein n=1 Tax=uncultured Winogradskyella sp. TaxID=395353 RepID=UPI002619A102|nr:carboxypeptidase-like regulatory domain-containing protein [uncultured Winogradskyella sp.]